MSLNRFVLFAPWFKCSHTKVLRLAKVSVLHSRWSAKLVLCWRSSHNAAIRPPLPPISSPSSFLEVALAMFTVEAKVGVPSNKHLLHGPTMHFFLSQRQAHLRKCSWVEML